MFCFVFCLFWCKIKILTSTSPPVIGIKYNHNYRTTSQSVNCNVTVRGYHLLNGAFLAPVKLNFLTALWVGKQMGYFFFKLVLQIGSKFKLMLQIGVNFTKFIKVMIYLDYYYLFFHCPKIITSHCPSRRECKTGKVTWLNVRDHAGLYTHPLLWPHPHSNLHMKKKQTQRHYGHTDNKQSKL